MEYNKGCCLPSRLTAKYSFYELALQDHIATVTVINNQSTAWRKDVARHLLWALTAGLQHCELIDATILNPQREPKWFKMALAGSALLTEGPRVA